MTNFDVTTPLKRCKSCGAEYPETTEYFHKHSTCINGLRAKCKTCRNREKLEYAHRPEVRERHGLPVLVRHRGGAQDKKATQKAYRARPEVKARKKKQRTAYRNSPEGKAYHRAYKLRPEVKARRRDYDRSRAAHKRGAGGTYTTADIEAIRVAQGNRCYLCGKKLTKYHIDHFIPIAKGGTNEPGNLRLSCPKCNLSKGAKHPYELGILI